MGSRRSSKGSKTTAPPAAQQKQHHHEEENDDLLVTKGASMPARASPSSSPEVQLRVNQRFAAAFEQRKRQEELSALEKRGLNADDDDDESDSETEDEDGEELTRELDADISKTLRLIRKKDPAIYDSSIAFFKATESESDSDSDDGKKSKKEEEAEAGLGAAVL
ncbi:Kri1 like protein [Phytophthora cinnamomi]|uniref:Kri1 like protein n=1 Tax=Phytophthora cinnamomi TaxID=4785 RepID=UPI003559E91E|nr:Kri1 like protein [Phytophthora cinnamomi]